MFIFVIKIKYNKYLNYVSKIIYIFSNLNNLYYIIIIFI